MKRTLLCCLCSAVLGGVVATWLMGEHEPWSVDPSAHAQTVAPFPTHRTDTTLVSGSPLSNSLALTPEEERNIQVYEVANRSVVNINTQVVAFDLFMMQATGQGSGSGSVLDKQGHILTNYHVIEDTKEVQVTLAGGKTYPAELVGADALHDIAILKIDAPPQELQPIMLGASDQLRVGQRVFALGNPFGLEGSLTTGIVSNLNRTLPSRVSGREMTSVIQTDAALNPGNSGGPLLDSSGRMVGMNVAIATKSGQNAGVGFAIPINRIRRFLPELIENGEIARPYIGIVAVNETDAGLQIVRTNRGGPADQAGLRGWQRESRKVRRGPIVYTVERDDPSGADYILAVDGHSVTTASQFVEAVERHRPGETVVLTILRDGSRMNVPVLLEEA